MAAVPIHIKKAVGNLVLGALTIDPNVVNHLLSEALEALRVCTVQKVGRKLEFKIRFADAFHDKPEFIAEVAALILSEQQ